MAHRRIAVLSSHLIPAGPIPPGVAQRSPEPDEPPCVATSSCSGGDAESQRAGEAGCVFCRIIRGESPAFKLYEDDVIASMCSKIPFLSNCIMKATQCDSFNLLVNNGSAAGQVIFHTHLHIIPRKAGDQLWPSESFRRQPIESNQEIVDLVNSVRDLVSSRS